MNETKLNANNFKCIILVYSVLLNSVYVFLL